VRPPRQWAGSRVDVEPAGGCDGTPAGAAGAGVAVVCAGVVAGGGGVTAVVVVVAGGGSAVVVVTVGGGSAGVVVAGSTGQSGEVVVLSGDGHAVVDVVSASRSAGCVAQAAVSEAAAASGSAIFAAARRARRRLLARALIAEVSASAGETQPDFGMKRGMLVQLSDPHIRDDTDDHGAAAALSAAVRTVMALDPKPDAVLVTGDIGNGGSDAEYERARELLSPLDVPVHVLPGNHDDPERLATAFGASGSSYATRCGPLRLVAVDTTIRGEDGGELGSERLAWLRATLAEDTATPTVLAMHHPPMLTGIRAMDPIELPADDRAALAELLAEHTQVRTLIAGHVHRAITGRTGPCPVFVCPSVHLTLALDLRPDGRPNVAVVDEPPALAIHLLIEGEVTSHVKPIGDFGPARAWA
jgi:Icc protein